MTSRVLRVAAVAALLVAVAARADEDRSEWEFEIGVPVEYIGGHTTYEISGSDASSSVRSELQFPVQGVLAGLRARLALPRVAGDPLWAFEVSAQHTLTEDTGTMKDSDWIDGSAELTEVGSAHPGKDIYSTSKAFLRALVLEARASGRFDLTLGAGGPALRLAPLAGVLYQSFSYVVVDVNQVGYGPWAAYSGSIGGRVLTYDVAWRALYAGARAELQRGELSCALEAWYSPFANGTDEDNHLLRSKLSKTDANGSAWQARAELRYALYREWALSLHGSVVGFSASGTQTQSFYAGPDAGTGGTIPAKLTSLRWSLGTALTMRL
jgi:outer membrane protease